MSEKESAEIVRDLLQNSMPSYVTREEFISTVVTIETKIELASAKTKLWVIGGVLAIMASGISGYVSLVNKLDRLTQALPAISQVQEGRAPWIQRQEQRDEMQDEVLRKLDKSYEPMPYQSPPR